MSSPADLEKLVKEYEKLYFAPGGKSKSTINSLNKLAESIGEMSAELEVKAKYGSLVKEEIRVPRRPNKVPILDRAYRLTDGRIVVVEAKFNNSLRGMTNDLVYAADDAAGTGAVEKVVLKGEVEQLSGQWVDNRIREIRKYNKRLANELKTAAENGKLLVAEYRATPSFDRKSKTISLQTNLTDESESIAKFFTQGRPVITDDDRAITRKLAKDEGFLSNDLRHAKAKQAKLVETLDDARANLKNAKRDLAKAEKRLREVKRPDTVKKWTDLVEQRKKQVAEAVKAFEASEQAARQGAEAAKAIKTNLETVRATQRARLAEQRGTKLAAMADSRLARAAGGVEKVAKAAKIAEEARPLARFAVKGLRILSKAGRFVFAVLDLANPIFDLLLLVDMIDWFVRWLDSDAAAERKEWARIVSFLLSEQDNHVTVYGINYQTSISRAVNSLVEYALAQTSGDARGFLYWYDKWNSQPKWSGFVYAVIDIELERQQALQRDPDESYNVKYYLGGHFGVSLSDTPPPNFKKAGPTVINAGAQDSRNYSTQGKPLPSYEPKYAYDVEISTLTVRYSPVQPVLSPFDFILIKCRILLSDLTEFIGRYDENIIEGWEFREEIVEGIKIDWLGDYSFAEPLRNDKIHFSIKALYWAIDLLSQHAPRAHDASRDKQFPKFTTGFHRRHQLMFELNRGRYSGKRTLYEIGLNLNNIVPGRESGYLAEFAFEIDKDIQRVWKRIHEDDKTPAQAEFNYLGKK